MIVLGESNDDKGTQLEVLTKRILQHRGYQDVGLNYISAGGEEIDVRGQYRVPGIVGQVETTMICECKAYRAAVRMPDWLKFLGKIFAADLRSGRPTAGTFIALSGVNGNVAGHYDEIRARRGDIALVIPFS